MAYLWFLFCLITTFLFVTDVNSYILNNDVVLSGFDNDHVEVVPSQNSYEESNKVSADKVKIMNPIMDDAVAVAVNTKPSSVLVLPDNTSVMPSRRNYLTNLMFQGIRAVMWRVTKFVICDIVSASIACGVMNVLSDEPERDNLYSIEGVARGLRLLENFIEIYHTANKRAA